LFAKSDTSKELILAKYANLSNIENQVEQEKWTYDYSNPFKSNSLVLFDKSGKLLKTRNTTSLFI
jgi:hypothetical protein